MTRFPLYIKHILIHLPTHILHIAFSHIKTQRRYSLPLASMPSNANSELIRICNARGIRQRIKDASGDETDKQWEEREIGLPSRNAA